jgi:hypothetical protein
MQQAEKFGWRVPEWAKSVGLSRAYVYELMNDGLIRSVKSGTARIITTHPQDYLSSLAEDQEGTADSNADGPLRDRVTGASSPKVWSGVQKSAT